jgi:hypothetical protein
MNDDRFDEDLRARLRSYEARMPDDEVPDVHRVARGHRVAWLAAASAVVVLVGAGIGVATRLPAGGPAATPSIDPSQQPSAAAATTPAASAPSAEPSIEATSTPTAPAATPTPPAAAVLPTSWSPAAEFAEEGVRYLAGDVESWSGGLIAVGTRYESDARNVFGPPPPHAGRVWLSEDGERWSDATPAGTFEGVELVDLFTASDGAVIVIGQVYPDEATFTPENVYYESTDGRAWSPARLDGFPVQNHRPVVASGPRGLVAIGAQPPDDPTGYATTGLSYSADGRRWVPAWSAEVGTDGPIEQVFRVDGGDEGFVALVGPTSGREPVRVIASADGRTWIDGAAPTQWAATVVGRHGDWIMADFADLQDRSPGQSVTTWFSANGLEWQPFGGVQLGVRDGEPVCPEVIGALHGEGPYLLMRTVLSYGCGEGAFYHPGAAYISGDGASWEPLPFGTLGSVEGVVTAGDRLVVLADEGTGTPSGGVAIWIATIP